MNYWLAIRLITLRIGIALLLFAAGIDLRVRLGGRGFIIAAEDAPPEPLILVLGARVHRSGRPSAMLQDRLETALAIHRSRGGRMLLSGDGTPGVHNEIRAMRAYLMQRGVPAAALCHDVAGFDTYESIARLRAAKHPGPVVIVTQRFHLTRALYLARGLGLDAHGVVADRRFYSSLLYSELREMGARMKAWFQLATGVRLEQRKPALTAACPAGVGA